MRLTETQIEAGRSPRGGWTRIQLAEWGVPWPPPKGWQNALVAGRDPIRVQRELTPLTSNAKSAHYRRKTNASDFSDLPMARFYFRKPYAHC
jgi:hypothetical protein